MIYIQCREAKFQIPSVTATIPAKPAAALSSADSILKALREPRQDSMASHQSRSVNRPPAGQFVRWGLEEAIGFYVMRDQLHWPISKIRTIIPITADMERSLGKHQYPSVTLYHAGNFITSKHTFAKDVCNRVRLFCKHVPDAKARLEHCFREGDDYRAVAAMIYHETEERSHALEGRKDASHSTGQNRDRGEGATMDADIRGREKEPPNHHASTRTDHGTTTTSNIAVVSNNRIVEAWNVLDAITFDILRIHMKCSAVTISEAMQTRLNDIERLMQNTNYELRDMRWPSRQYSYRGQSFMTVAMSSSAIYTLLKNYFKLSGSLTRIRKQYELERLGCESAAALIYHETYPQVKELVSQDGSGHSDAISNQRGPSTMDEVPLFHPVSSENQHSNNAARGSLKRARSDEAAASVSESPSRAFGHTVKTWSHLNHIQKRSRMEPAPLAATLELVIPGRLTTAEARKVEAIMTNVHDENTEESKSRTVLKSEEMNLPDRVKSIGIDTRADHHDQVHAARPKKFPPPRHTSVPTIAGSLETMARQPSEDSDSEDVLSNSDFSDSEAEPLMAGDRASLSEPTKFDRSAVNLITAQTTTVPPQNTTPPLKSYSTSRQDIHELGDLLKPTTEAPQSEIIDRLYQNQIQKHNVQQIRPRKIIKLAKPKWEMVSSSSDAADETSSCMGIDDEYNRAMSGAQDDYPSDSVRIPVPMREETPEPQHVLNVQQLMALKKIFLVPDITLHKRLVEKYITLKVPAIACIPDKDGNAMIIPCLDILLTSVSSHTSLHDIGMSILHGYLDLIRNESDRVEYMIDHDTESLDLTSRYLELL